MVDLMTTDTLLDARNVTIRFGGLTAVSEFNLSIRPGELLGLIGPNGAGKTTLFNMLTGVYKPTEGEIRIAGTSTRDMKPYEITSLGEIGRASCRERVEISGVAGAVRKQC